MFDFQTSTYPCVDTACRRFSQSHNLTDLAAAMSISAQVLRNKLNQATYRCMRLMLLRRLELSDDKVFVGAVADEMFADKSVVIPTEFSQSVAAVRQEIIAPVVWLESQSSNVLQLMIETLDVVKQLAELTASHMHSNTGAPLNAQSIKNVGITIKGLNDKYKEIIS